MKKHSFIITLTYILLLFFPKNFSGQNVDSTLKASPAEINLLLYGNSDELINGMQYIPKHPLAKGNPFYDGRSKINGTIYIKGNKYAGQVIGYDIVEQVVILSAFQKNSAQFEVKLNESVVDSMIVGNSLFVNAATNIIPGFDNGFLEIIYKGGVLFVAKHKKVFMSQYSSSSPNGFYTEDKVEYFLIFGNEPIRVSSKKSLLKEFEPDKKEIKKFMKSIKFKFKKANKAQWVRLLYFCDNLSSK